MAKDSIKIDVSELHDLLRKINQASGKTLRLLDRAIDESAILLDEKAKEKIQKGPRSGKTYRRGGKSGRRSAAGEAPKTDTGRLVSSIRPEFKGFMDAEVGSLANIAPYGGILEDTDKLNRPWLKPTLDENEPAIWKKLDRAIKAGGLAS